MGVGKLLIVDYTEKILWRNFMDFQSILVIVIIAGAAYYLFNKRKKTSNKGGTTGGGKGSISNYKNQQRK